MGWRIGWLVVVASVGCADAAAIEDTRELAAEQAFMSAAPRFGLKLSRIAAAHGEDGAGHDITATDPVAIDVTADQFPARALDPVLHVGGVQFVHYTFPERGVMRFVAADAAFLIPGTEAALQWGEQRIVLSRSLAVPR